MLQSRDHIRLGRRAFLFRLAALVLLAVSVIVKAGLLVGGGAGSGVLTFRGRNYPFRISGVSLGITAGATVGRLDGWASGIRDIGDFAGTYASVGGGAALVGGVNAAGTEGGGRVRRQSQSGHDFSEVSLRIDSTKYSRASGLPVIGPSCWPATMRAFRDPASNYVCALA
jgi:hypothetical protein